MQRRAEESAGRLRTRRASTRTNHIWHEQVQGTRRLCAQGQEAHGMMDDDEGNGDKKVVPMLLKNIQFKGSQPQTTAEAVKRPEEAFRRGAATNGIKTKRGPISYDVQMFAPCTMSKHDPQGRGVRWAAKVGITHVMTQPMWNRRSRVYNSEKDKWMITDEGWGQKSRCIYIFMCIFERF